MISEILDTLPQQFDKVKNHILSNDMDRLAEHCKKYYKSKIKLLMLPLLHRRNLEYRDTYHHIADVSQAMQMKSTKFHQNDAELIDAGFYNKDLVRRPRTDMVVSAAENKLREFKERGIIEHEEHKKILAEIKKLTKYQCVASLKKYLVNIMLIITMGRVTGQEDNVRMKLLGESVNDRLSIRIKRVRHDLTNER